MKSNREAEEHFSEQMYDFTFPVYQSKLDRDLYREQPFVSVVAAPRVVLLVYDGPQVQNVNFDKFKVCITFRKIIEIRKVVHAIQLKGLCHG